MANISVYLNTLRQKGYLAYEYNPFHNYQTNVNLYQYDNKYLIPEGCAINLKNGMILHSKNGKWVDDQNNILENNDPNIITQYSDNVSLLYTAGSLIDLDTDKLNFDLNHPVDITVQPSYDGSVNLILNDGKNIPRLINSRFSAREKGTYEIVDRIGENDTNIYSSETFEKDTSLYFQYEKNPLVEFQGLYEGGDLLAGAYCYYFTYCDADDNESDIIAETGIIHVFMGTNGYPESVEGGIKNMNTHKQIVLQLSNLDKSYNYLKVYQVRYLADYGQNRVSECKKIIQKYPIKSSKVTLQIKGTETSEDMDANLLNLTQFNPKDILTQAQCKNMLFFGNIHKNTDNYKELQDCALRIIPNIELTTLKNIDNNYKIGGTTSAYYNSNNMYNLTGYFNNEYYRFGVVFIYKNGTLSSVYNTLGGVLTSSRINYKTNPNTLYEDTPNSPILVRKYIQTDDFGWIKNASDFFKRNDNSNIECINARGVCKIDWKSQQKINDDTVLGINFYIPPSVVKFLKEDLGIRGLFFVRQKRMSNLIAQCYLMPFDELLEAPVIELHDKNNPDTKQRDYYTECFLTQGHYITVTFRSGFIFRKTYTRTYLVGDRIVSNNYSERLYKYTRPKETLSSHAYAAICPDFLLNQPYYNQIFNNSKFELEKVTENAFLQTDTEQRQFLENPNVQYLNSDSKNVKEVTLCSVTEDVPTVALEEFIYRLEQGKANEVFRFKYAEIDKSNYNAGEEDFDAINSATNLVRGKYSPYLAVFSSEELDTSELYNIYVKGNRFNVRQNITDRMNDYSGFYSISDRYNFENLSLITVDDNTYYSQTCYRGDCYINTFTFRLNRNFNDSTLPNNDTIIDGDTWKNNYDAGDSSKWGNIYRSDINAVQMGSWITFKCRSYMNYALRSQDYSYVSEAATMGSPRTYFPKTKMGWKGENKMPDSYVFNDAYRTSLGYKCYYALQDINYIKDCFSNRIQYSAVAIQDSYKNNYRQSYSTYFRDYSQEYGSIQKLIGFEGHLLVVLEHAIGLAVVNERVLAGSGDGEPVFINTQNVLPEELTILTDTYGTQWPESVIKTETGAVYGVDTIAKKIWKVSGQQIEIISDFAVNKFLVDNITLGERERYPIIGLKNVKTHYNNNKKDVMFTFYDDIYKGEEKVWNLCYNELLGKFITFYSWVPSYSENIDTQFFTFDRKVSKELSLLDKCNYSNPNNSGVLVDPVILKPDPDDGKYRTQLHYVTEKIDSIKSIAKDDYKISSTKSEINCTFELEHDSAQNWKYFELEDILDENDNTRVIGNNLILNIPPDITHEEGGSTVIDKTGLEQIYDVLNSWNSRTFILEITPKINSTEVPSSLTNTGFSQYFKTETIAVTLEGIVNNNKGSEHNENIPTLNTDFFLHGQAGIFDLSEGLFPTHWYGEFHPFEFEFVVNEKTGIQKVFYNLEIISNKAEPESFHFQIEGDNYEFSSDKRAMYFRQEATKELFQNLGSNMLFDRDYKDVASKNFTYEQYYRGNPIRGDRVTNEYTDQYINRDRVYPVESHGLVQQVKSTIFPLYYERIDTYNDIYHIYRGMLDGNPDTGYDFKNLSGSEILWDKRLNQFNIVTHIKNSPINLYGRLRGNSFYKEGKWFVQIPSIVFNQKNESPWGTTSGEFQLDYSSLDSEDHLEVQGQSDPLAVPPLVINSSNIPNDLSSENITPKTLPNIYRDYNTIDHYEGQDSGFYSAIDTNNWTGRKETRIRDKWIKIRVRYSGKNLAIIHSVITLFNISPS